MGLFDHMKKKKETEQAVNPNPNTMGFLLFDMLRLLQEAESLALVKASGVW